MILKQSVLHVPDPRNPIVIILKQSLLNTRALPLTRGSSQRCWMTSPGNDNLKIDNYGFNENDHISANNGPILKIKTLA